MHITLYPIKNLLQRWNNIICFKIIKVRAVNGRSFDDKYNVSLYSMLSWSCHHCPRIQKSCILCNLYIPY